VLTDDALRLYGARAEQAIGSHCHVPVNKSLSWKSCKEYKSKIRSKPNLANSSFYDHKLQATKSNSMEHKNVKGPSFLLIPQIGWHMSLHVSRTNITQAGK
jgi:hypothetical protein